MRIVWTRAGVDSGIGIGIDFNSNSNSRIGIGIASHGIGIGIAKWNWPELNRKFSEDFPPWLDTSYFAPWGIFMLFILVLEYMLTPLCALAPIPCIFVLWTSYNLLLGAQESHMQQLFDVKQLTHHHQGYAAVILISNFQIHTKGR